MGGKRNRGPGALGRNRGTGFEEYYADPPMTPDEAYEEKTELYHPNFPFDERIQVCIQRFRNRRRLTGRLTTYFDSYLFLGGVDVTPGAYSGIDPKALKNMSPAERREATAHDIVHGVASGDSRFYNGDMEKWEVDFAGVAAGYFSTLQQRPLEAHEMMEPIGVVENFLKYVLHHDVCPEYAGNINQALEICKEAREEWPMVERLQKNMPGRFNLAISKASGAFKDDDWGFVQPDQIGDTKMDLLTTLALAGETELFDAFSQKIPEVVKEAECTLEVCSVAQLGSNEKKNFKRLTINGQKASIPPIGKVTFKPAVVEGPIYDLPRPFPFVSEKITIFSDDHIVQDLKKGMKMTAVICELQGGFFFLKRLCDIFPSFYVYLPQELMLYYKEPRAETRPPPSVKKIQTDENVVGDKNVEVHQNE